MFIHIDSMFDPANIQPMLNPFLPEWLEGSQNIIMNLVMETSFKVDKADQIRLTNKVLELYKLIYDDKQFDFFKKLMIALVSKQENLIREVII
jgi:hypothetical protein